MPGKNKYIARLFQNILVVLLVLILFVSSVSADFFKDLQTPFYDPGGQSCGSSTLVGADNEEKTWNYFKGKGLGDKQVAGIMGNIQQESSFNPEVMQKGGNSKNPADADPLGWGLIQWTPGSKVIGMAQDAGVSGQIYELGTQLDLIWQHMHNKPPITRGDFNLTDFKAIKDERQAATYFLEHIEAGTDPGGVRESNATAILQKYGGSSSGGGGGSCGVVSGDCGVNRSVYQAQYSQQQLANIFGDPGTADSHPDLHLVTVSFLGHHAQVSPLVAPCLEATSQQLQAQNTSYEIRQFGCYRFDSDNGSSNIGLRSYHTYGAACDINWDTNPYVGSGRPAPHDMPAVYIKAFRDHGFTWGGNWSKPKDYMHFEWHGVIP